jgi:hypothetical protein
MPEAPRLLPWLLARAGLVAVAAAAASAVLARSDGRRSIWRAALPVSATSGAGRRLAFDLIVAMVTLRPASPGGPLASSP